MAVNLAVTIKNSALFNAFKPANIYLQIPNEAGSPNDLFQPALFSNASGGVISLATPVQFAVPSQGELAPTIIDRVDIVTVSGGSAPANNIIARINLEGDEIITFEENGVYIIEQIDITFL